MTDEIPSLPAPQDRTEPTPPKSRVLEKLEVDISDALTCFLRWNKTRELALDADTVSAMHDLVDSWKAYRRGEVAAPARAAEQEEKRAPTWRERQLYAALCDLQNEPNCWCDAGEGGPIHSPACAYARDVERAVRGEIDVDTAAPARVAHRDREGRLVYGEYSAPARAAEWPQLIREELDAHEWNMTRLNYCWWCQRDVNGRDGASKQPHGDNCWGVRASALLMSARAAEWQPLVDKH